MDMNAAATADRTEGPEQEAPKDSPQGEGANHAAIEHLERTIRASLAKGQATGREALTSFRDIGEALNEAKEIHVKGAFGDWAEAQFGFSKEWRARLMRLAKDWRLVLDAFEWAEKLGRVLGRKEYSVDGALALLKEYEVQNDPEAQAAAEAKKAEREAKKAEAGERKETEAEELRRLLAEAMDRINKLEAELGKARKGSSKAQQEAPKGTASEAPSSVSAADKGKARKVHGLYKGGATDGERDAAKARLEALAEKNGMTFEAFLSACGLAV